MALPSLHWKIQTHSWWFWLFPCAVLCRTPGEKSNWT